MMRLKPIYVHRQLTEKIFFDAKEVEEREDKQFISESVFLYDENTKMVYHQNKLSKVINRFTAPWGSQYYFIDHEIVLKD